MVRFWRIALLLKNRSSSEEPLRKPRNVCLFVSRKEGFVSRTSRNGAVRCLFQEPLVSRIQRIKSFCFFVSGKRKEKKHGSFLKNRSEKHETRRQQEKKTTRRHCFKKKKKHETRIKSFVFLFQEWFFQEQEEKKRRQLFVSRKRRNTKVTTNNGTTNN